MLSLKACRTYLKGISFFMVVRCTRVCVLFCVLLFSRIATSQDPIFTQFSIIPIQINPAFVGNSYAPIVSLNTRLQWPSFGSAYRTLGFSADRFFESYNLGLGTMVSLDDSGDGIYKQFKVDLIASYRLKVREGHFLKMGLGFGLGRNVLNWDKLIFGDQIDDTYGYQLPNGNRITSKEDVPGNLSVNYPDLSAGLLYYSKQIYFGVGVKHANSPEVYYGSNDVVNNGLPVRYSVIVGGEKDLSDFVSNTRAFYSPGILYVNQAGQSQLTFHNYLNIGSIFANIGYRYDIVNSDAIIFGVGFSKDLIKIAYSFDYTISKLGISSGGAHELGIMLNFDKSTLFDAPFRYSDCFNMFR